MSRRILVADDSSTIQKVIKIAFARMNVEMLEASSFVEALALSRRQPPDLAIIDASLPGAHGPDDFAKLSRDAGNAPVLLLFGTYDAVDEVAFRQAGFPHFLKKPFESADLVAMADRLLGGELSRGVAATRREVPTEPPAPHAPLPTGRTAHTTVIFDPGTFPQNPPDPIFTPAHDSGPSYDDLDADLGATNDPLAGLEMPSPPAITDESRRGRPAYADDPPPTPRPPQGRPTTPPPPGRTVPPTPPGGSGASDPRLSQPGSQRDPRDLSRETRDGGSRDRPTTPPTPAASRTAPPPPGRTTPPPSPGRTQPPQLGVPSIPVDFGLGEDEDEPRARPALPGASAAGRQAPPPMFDQALAEDDVSQSLEKRLPDLVKQAVEDYCERHFKSLAREIIAAELRRLADEKARHLVDN